MKKHSSMIQKIVNGLIIFVLISSFLPASRSQAAAGIGAPGERLLQGENTPTAVESTPTVVEPTLTETPTDIPTTPPTETPTGIPPTETPAATATEPLPSTPTAAAPLPAEPTEVTPVPTEGATQLPTSGYSAARPESAPLTSGEPSLLGEPPSLASSLASWGSTDMDSNGKLNQPNGVAVDAAGNVYVADTENRRIKKYNSSGTFLLQWGEWDWEDWNFDYPTGIAVDKTNAWVYVADDWGNDVKKFDLNGNYLTSWGGWGSANGQFKEAVAVAVNQSNGDVYVADIGNKRIQGFDSDGVYITQWGPTNPGGGVNFEWIWGLTVDSSGNVYVTDQGSSIVQKFTSTGSFLAKLGDGCGFENGEVCGPYGITVDSANNVYISDDTQRVQKFNSSLVYLGKWGTPGNGAGQLNYPRGLAVDSSGNIFVADLYNHRIQKFNAAFVYQTRWGSNVTGNGQLSVPEGIALSPDGASVYVADTRNHRLQKFNASGVFQAAWGSQGYGYQEADPKKYTNVPDVAVDNSGYVYVLDQWDNRVVKLTSNGVYQMYFGGDWGSGPGEFSDPWSIALDNSGNLYVADQGNNRIQKFDPGGTYITAWGSYGNGNSQFEYNLDIAVDRAGGWVYVADTDNHRIQKFDLSGGFLTEWGSWGSGANQFDRPSGVAVDSSGRVYVTDRWNTSVKVFTSDGNFLGAWGGWGSGDGQFMEPMDVVIDPSNNVYVVDKGGGYRVQKFEPFFTTSTPSPPTLLTPSGSTSSYVPGYKWNVSSGATRYALIIDSGAEKVFSMYPYCNAATCEVWFFDPLSLGAHTFEVKAGNASGWSASSAAKSFTVVANGPASLQALWGWADAGSGKNMRQPDDVAVDRTNNVMYVADSMARNIYKYDLDGNLLLTFGDCCWGIGRLNWPSALTVDNEHNLLVADSANARIVKFDPNGVFLATFGEWGSGDGQFNWPVGIGVDASGNIYVSDSDNHNVQKFDSDGIFIIKWGTQGSGDGEFSYPYGIAVDGAYVYVADLDNHRIQKFTQAGVYSGQWGSFGSGDSQFKYTISVEVDNGGDILVGDYWGHRIQKFNSSGVYISQWGAPGRGDGQFNSPRGIAVDSDGNVYVADTWNSRIQKFDSTYIFDSQWGTNLTANGLLNSPGGILLNPAGTTVYVADRRNHRIQLFSASGVYQSSFGSPGFGNGEFNYAPDLVMDSGSNLYVVDVANHRIQKFDSSGSYQAQWGSYGSGDGQFKYPTGIGIDSSGNIYVADNENHRVQMFASDGDFITKWGSEGSGDGQFEYPNDIAIGSNGYVYVTDTDNNRIQKFTTAGVFVAKWGTQGSGNGQFEYPGWITIDQNNAVWVADSWNDRVQVFSPDGIYLNKLDNGCCWEAGQLITPQNLAVDNQGYLYVSDVGNRVQKFTAPDANDAPTDITLTSTTIIQNSPLNTQVATLTTTDPESGTEAYTYSLVTTAGTGTDGGACAAGDFADNALFQVGTGTDANKLFTAGTITTGAKKICLRSTDNGIPNAYYTKAITFTVIPVWSLRGTVSFTTCPALKLGGGLVATFGAFTGAVNFVDGTYSIDNIVDATTGTVTITQPSDGYTIIWKVGSTTNDYTGGGGVTANHDTIDFTAVGNRTISGTFTGPIDLGTALRVPSDGTNGGAFVTLANCVIFPVQTGAQPTAFSIAGLPAKAFVLRPVYDEGALAASPIATLPASIQFSASQYANTTYSNVTGKAFTFTWNNFTIGGSAKNNYGANLSGATTVTLTGTGVFALVNGTGTANTTGTWSAFSPFRKPASGVNDPQPYTANITFANPKYQDFVLGTGNPQTFDITKTNAVTGYGAAAIYGLFGGYSVPEETVVNFGGGLSSNIEDAGQFLLGNLEPKSYTLSPTATGIYFTNSSILYAQASQAIAATALGTDATGKFYAWKLPTPLTPANNAVLPLADPKSPTFTWTAVPGATGYDIQVSTVATFPAGVNTKTVSLGAVTTYTPAAGDIYNFITSGVKYYWGVKANGAGAGTGEYTHKFPAFQTAFKTNNLAPTIGLLTFAGNVATFNWTASQNAIATNKYMVEYNNSPTLAGTTTKLYAVFPAVIANTTIVTPPAKTYYFRVTLLNAANVPISVASAISVGVLH